MPKLRVNSFSISLDGYGAGPDQELANPLGVGGMALHTWAFKTRTLRQMFGQEGGSTEIDDGFAARGMANIGAWILGRNMFGPVRGLWPDETWKGWWGNSPPYHVPVFVLTNHKRAPLTMEGGTTFHFVTDGIEAALARAKEAAGEKDIRVGGGVATIRQYLAAGVRRAHAGAERHGSGDSGDKCGFCERHACVSCHRHRLDRTSRRRRSWPQPDL